ncbi:4-hydroxyproline epimerase [Gemmata obscuriglobus]|uniref:Hydroxyproline-2-epimerase n=1 Tax=Gemmata obscuriglobus TaxID=114 RepID=A0A2Z3H0I5_9BACT|nr:proline racemase family protein [Gemmata obscuriglobus]AWM36625.1 hydroxyproline-2-epimerase [Gemmata obscuriglobus]QEG30738.1 4-hydroxyproline epimerase [Gemmata obscuriglobus]VTS10068.1 hydroxyproline-2-epimerase : 4-hydroxyproline epimerase OS=Collimonas arenae GN=LT85_0637 PE=4 SV=1: Pro_racemase [Gemmata obscuriglobus UQM 2246]
MQRVRVIDSHTGGEPTRVVVSGGPDLGTGPLAARCDLFRREFDRFRSAVVNEPRGSDVLVGALLVEPHEPGCAAGVIYFNNVGPLGMCGHATIGLAVTLAHLGRTAPGRYRVDTPVGPVVVEHRGGPTVGVLNVPSYRHAAGVVVPVEGVGPVTGDVAWGGNWFFLTAVPDGLRLDVGSVGPLTDYALRVRAALERAGVTGAGGAPIDHIELIGPPADPNNNARNFVLCPGGAYDRSPCGTGTSAKLACLAADGKLKPGAVWRQEGILGAVFEGRYEPAGSGISPHITGTAYLTAESDLLFDPADPFRMGVRA